MFGPSAGGNSAGGGGLAAAPCCGPPPALGESLRSRLWRPERCRIVRLALRCTPRPRGLRGRGRAVEGGSDRAARPSGETRAAPGAARLVAPLDRLVRGRAVFGLGLPPSRARGGADSLRGRLRRGPRGVTGRAAIGPGPPPSRARGVSPKAGGELCGRTRRKTPSHISAVCVSAVCVRGVAAGERLRRRGTSRASGCLHGCLAR